MPSIAQKSSFRDDYDSCQPCFFESETEEDFYQDEPIPSEAIWKKFELLTTPPRSPRRDEDMEANLQDPTMEQLVEVSDILDCFGGHNCQLGKDKVLLNKCKECTQTIKLNLIQDCMWSTTWLNNNKLNNSMDNVKPSKLLKDSDDKSGNTCDSEKKLDCQSCHSRESSRKRRSSRTRCDSGVSIDIPTTDCVDPTAVFPFAMCERTSSSVGSTGTPSDSEEEIDVVSVGEKKQQQFKVATSPELQQHLLNVRTSQQRSSPRSIINKKNVSMLKSVPSPSSVSNDSNSNSSVTDSVAAMAMHNYTQPTSAEPSSTKLSFVISRSTECHNYGLKRTLSDNSSLQHIPNKKYKRSSHRFRSSGTDSRSSSDSEDCMGKRSQHNDMERKRRIDLKVSFLELRDQVPELHKQERAPKVTILRKASEYIYQLRDNETELLSELKKQKERKEELARKLASLQKSTWF